MFRHEIVDPTPGAAAAVGISPHSNRSSKYPHKRRGGAGGQLLVSPTKRWMILRSIVLFSLLLLFFLLFWLQRSLVQTTSNSLDRNSNASTRVSRDACNEAIQRLIDAEIQLVAFDFDFTLVDVHTGGVWKRSAADLAQHVRPDFVVMIEQCLDRGLRVCVATFSTQKTLIAEVLGLALGTERASAIPVWGGADAVENYTQGKQSQLYLAVDYFNQRNAQRARTIYPANTLLVDDDVQNIDIARRNGYQTLPYRPGTSICLTQFSGSTRSS